MRLLLGLLLLQQVHGVLAAQEFSAGLGRLHAIGASESTYSWQIQYLQNFGASWGVSLAWLNEGHLPDHHRDGAVLQGWALHRMERNGLQLGLGLGAYSSFDTTDEVGPVGYGFRRDRRNGNGCSVSGSGHTSAACFRRAGPALPPSISAPARATPCSWDVTSGDIGRCACNGTEP